VSIFFRPTDRPAGRMSANGHTIAGPLADAPTRSHPENGSAAPVSPVTYPRPIPFSLDQGPSRKAIKRSLDLLRDLIFGPGNLRPATVNSTLRSLLAAEARKGLVAAFKPDSTTHLVPGTEELESTFQQHAHEIVAEFCAALPEIQDRLRVDVGQCFQGDPAAKSPLEIVLCYPGIEAIFVHRIAHQLHKQRLPLVPRMLAEICHCRTGIDIHPGATIGCPFFIDHGTGVVIGETAVVGNNVTLFHNVTLGAISTAGGQALAGLKRHPTIEDDVTIYAGAAVLGGKTVIGKGAIIGGGLLICRSVPAGHVAKQLPAEQRYLVVPNPKLLTTPPGDSTPTAVPPTVPSPPPAAEKVDAATSPALHAIPYDHANGNGVCPSTAMCRGKDGAVYRVCSRTMADHEWELRVLSDVDSAGWGI